MNFSLGVHANASRHCLSSPEPAQVHLDNAAPCHGIIPTLSQGRKMIEVKKRFASGRASMKLKFREEERNGDI